MKRFSTLLKIAIVAIVFFSFSNANAIVGTAGTLTFSVKPTAPSADYGTEHVVAIWITDNADNFVKTKAEFGVSDNFDHLATWDAKSGANTVDATTGATITDYSTTISITWNGTNVAGNVVADGVYKVWVELGWGEGAGDHAVTSYSFDKGAVSVSPTLTGNNNFLNPTLTWTPTGVGIVENTNSTLSVFPSPASDVLNVNLGSKVEDTKIEIYNAIGAVVYTNNYNQASGLVRVDLKDISNGVYFVNVKRSDIETKTKVFVVK